MNLEHRLFPRARHRVAITRVHRMLRNAPDFLIRFAIRRHPQQDGADAIVSGGNEDEIIMHHGHHGIDRIVREGLEPASEVYLTIRGVQ